MSSVILFSVILLGLFSCENEREKPVQKTLKNDIVQKDNFDYCNCIPNSEISERLRCDTTFFDKGDYIFWKVNCDSITLNYYTSAGKTHFLARSDDLEGRLGKSYVGFYDNYILLRSRQIIGCCMPNEFELIGRNSGKSIRFIDVDHIIGFKHELDLLVYLGKDNRDIIIHNLREDRLIKFSLGEIDLNLDKYYNGNGFYLGERIQHGHNETELYLYDIELEQRVEILDLVNYSGAI